jgi:hypothetical protein
VQRHVFRARLFHLTASSAQLTEDLTLMPLVSLHDEIEEKNIVVGSGASPLETTQK